MRKKGIFSVEELDDFKKQLLIWSNSFTVCCYLDSNNYLYDQYSSYECLVGVGMMEDVSYRTLDISEKGNAFDSLKAFYEEKKDWIFGFLGYDLKNDVEDLTSQNLDNLGLPDMYFFQPKHIIYIQKQKIYIEALNPEQIFQKITQTPINQEIKKTKSIEIQQRISKNLYLEKVAAIQQEILRGEIYEMNFCQEFYAEQVEVVPLQLYRQLNDIAKSPFAVYFKMDNQYLLCQSPERFLKKEQNRLLSQPIKGTIKRGKNATEDDLLKVELSQNPKERAENIMIVDLVRNDLTRTAQTASIKVKELCQVYSFEQVHHLISTIESTLSKEMHFVDAIRHAFPMGSMTGCPKIRSMELIEQYEESKRGLYSGSVGYCKPNGDFDFNVVIRSILYHKKNLYLSFQIGGAITYDSKPSDEYEECLLKAKAILEVLSN